MQSLTMLLSLERQKKIDNTKDDIAMSPPPCTILAAKTNVPTYKHAKQVQMEPPLGGKGLVNEPAISTAAPTTKEDTLPKIPDFLIATHTWAGPGLPKKICFQSHCQ